jgi:uncharacterized glyoxalase superfamily protein PhnB
VSVVLTGRTVDKRQWHPVARARGSISAGVVTVEAGLPIDGLYRRAIAAGATVEGPPISLPWGPKEFVLVLPEGHRLEVVAAA